MIDPPVALNQPSPSLPYRSPSPYYSHPPNTVSYYQDQQPIPVPGACDNQRTQGGHYVPRAYKGRYVPLAPPAHIDHTSRSHADHYRPPPTPGTTHWVPYEPLKRKHDEIQHGEDNEHTKQNLTQDVPGQGQADRYRPTYRTTQPEYEFRGPPHLPGAAQYLQRRESQNDPHKSAEVPVHTPSSSTVQTSNTERTRLTRSHIERFTTAQPPTQLPVKAESVVNVMNNQAPRSSHTPPKRSARVSSLPRGTQYAPLEISSSPEPETKRRKTADISQTARSKPRETPRPTGSMSYDGFSRQELTKMLTESTDIKPRKVRYYAVAVGREPGVYFDWSSAEKQVHGFFGAKHKKFKTKEEALAYIEIHRELIDKASSMQISRPTAQRSLDFGFPSNSTSYEQAQPLLQRTTPLDLNQFFAPLDDEPKSVLDDEPKLVPEQQHVVDLIVQGHNVFYTGSAGCGKSTILKAFVRQLQQKGKRVRIVAPTNLAALNVGGQTTWNYAGWTPDSMKIRIDKLMENSRGKESWKKFDETDVLVIDEISMIENLQFERLNMILKASRGEKYGGGAFGGVQMIVTGDVRPPAQTDCSIADQRSSTNLLLSNHSVAACADGNWKKTTSTIPRSTSVRTRVVENILSTTSTNGLSEATLGRYVSCFETIHCVY